MSNQNLLKKYGDRVVMKPRSDRFDILVIYFSDAEYKLLNDTWYENKEKI